LTARRIVAGSTCAISATSATVSTRRGGAYIETSELYHFRYILDGVESSPAVATLDNLPLERRVGAALNVLETWPSLDVTQRHELLAVALWPDQTVMIPSGEPTGPLPHATAEERQAAVELVRRGVSTSDVAARYAVSERSVRRWIGEQRTCM